MFQDEHASPKDRARRTADVETLERLGQVQTLHDTLKVQQVRSVLMSTSIWMRVCEEQLVFRPSNGWTEPNTSHPES